MHPHPQIRWGLSPRRRRGRSALKPRLARLWADVFPKDDEPYTSVIVPSVTVDEGDLARLGATRFYEEALLFLLMRLRNPQARVVYVTSQPIPAFVMDYYLHLLAGIPASHAASRITLLSVHDASPRALTQKILERPRLLEKIRAAIPDLSRAYMTVFRASPLERRLATLLDIPLNAADPELEPLCAKSAGRQVLREAGVDVPLGCEGLRDEDDLVSALQRLAAERPGLRRAVVKLDRSDWEEGHALVDLPTSTTRDAVRRALHGLRRPRHLAAPAYPDPFALIGGLPEESAAGPE